MSNKVEKDAEIERLRETLTVVMRNYPTNIAEARIRGRREGLEAAAKRHDGWAAEAAVRANDAHRCGNFLQQKFELTEVKIHEASAADLRADEHTLAALDAADTQARGGWRPIESAPKDGTPILLAWPYWAAHAVIGNWSNSSGDWECERRLSTAGNPPSAWQPLPPLPEPAPQEGGEG